MTKLGPYLLGPNDTKENGIYQGDAIALAEDIPNESIDIIITDPPYPREFIHLYGWLAKEGLRILKDGTWLFAYGATDKLPQRLALMEQSGLDYFWTFALLHHGGYPRLWHKKLMSGYKPIFVYTKGTPVNNPWMSTVHSNTMDKRFHKWGQGIGFVVKMIEMLTKPGDTILDFFCGGGQIPAACKSTGRNYLAFEQDKDVCRLARKRVCDTQLPLFVQQEKQLGLMEK